MATMSDAFAGLWRSLDSMCIVTQSKLLGKLAHQHERLLSCEHQLHLATQQHAVVRKQHALDHAKWEHESEELRLQIKRLQTRLQHDKHERNEEKEWIAGLWPDGVLLPTLLRPYAVPETTDASSPEEPPQGDGAGRKREETKQIEALMRRRLAKEKVLHQLDEASQWKMIVMPLPDQVPPPEEETQDGESHAEDNAAEDIPATNPPPRAWQVYYLNKITGESVLNAPSIMFYEPPAHWDWNRMDWKDSYGLQHFYAPDDEDDSKPHQRARNATASDDDGSDEDDKDDSDDDENDEAEPEPIDPVAARAELTQAMEKTKEIANELEKCRTEERALALQLLNATRDSFEREKEEIATLDEAVKDAERQRRKEKKQQEESAKATAQAQARKAAGSSSVQLKYGRDSVAKKNLTLTKDDELLERELEEFAVEQRRDRFYLTMPLSTSARVRVHRQWDPEYVHMKHMEEITARLEQIEFDLLEKSSIRMEEAHMKSEEMVGLCAQIRTAQIALKEEIAALEQEITEREVPIPTPANIERPSEADLLLAAEKLSPRSGGEKSSNDDDDNKPYVPHISAEDGVVSANEVADIMAEEAELQRLRRCVEAETIWLEWEQCEKERMDALAAVKGRRDRADTHFRHFEVDLALYDTNAVFFEKIKIFEKQQNDRLWRIQADSQVERARFMIERAMREESVLEMELALGVLQDRYELAQRLPIQALNVVERCELEKESAEQCLAIENEITRMQKRYSKEIEARGLLITLEQRWLGYATSKLEEEQKLMEEKQLLWDLNYTLEEEIQASRQTIERIYIALQTPQIDENGNEVQSPNPVLQEEAAAVFEAKVKAMEHTREFLLLCYEREGRWRLLAPVPLIKDTSSDEWMTTHQRERHEELLSAIQLAHEDECRGLRRELKLLNRVKSVLQSQVDSLTEKVERLQREYQDSSDAVRVDTEHVIVALRAQIADKEREMNSAQAKAASERARLSAQHDRVRQDLERRLMAFEELTEKQRHWLTSVKRELLAQRVANEELLRGYQAIEKRRATEINDQKFRIGAQITRINNIEMWNLSLKLQAKEAHVERIQIQKKMAQQVREHKELQRLLRRENWKQRVAVQAILTDVDLLFGFFADGIEILAGATPTTNDALRRNGGIEVVAMLAQHCCQPRVRAICTRALGQIAWNANVTQRALGWKAKHMWLSWMQTQSKRVEDILIARQQQFDDVASAVGTEMNWLADTSDAGGAGEVDNYVQSRAKPLPDSQPHRKVHFLKTWNQYEDLVRPNMNAENQEYMGLAPGVLKTLIDLCEQKQIKNDEDDAVVLKQIQRNALLSLAIIVLNSRNTSIIGRLENSIPLLVQLMEPQVPPEDPHVVRHAIQALSNLAHRNTMNQQMILERNAVPVLLGYCNTHSDVDLIWAATQCLANLSYENAAVCVAVFDSEGIGVLTRLCHSYRIHDVVELELYEEIQTCAAEVISNVVALVDEQPSALHRDVATAVLEAEVSETHQDVSGVSAFVLMCASCNRTVAFHGALVLGNIAQHDEIRGVIGQVGGIDALFLLLDQPLGDREMAVQVTWSLANLTWNRDNQYRIARYLDKLYELCALRVRPSRRWQQARLNRDDNNNDREDTVPSSTDEDIDSAAMVDGIREHALCIVANSLFYNDANRQLLASEARWLELLRDSCWREEGTALEHAARAYCALSYSDVVALAMGQELVGARNGLQVFIRLCAYASNSVVQKHGLYGLINLCLHDANKTKLLDVPKAVETLVNLTGSTQRELSDAALEVLDLLADIRHGKQHGHATNGYSAASLSALAVNDMKKLISLLSETSNPALIALASDAIADETWKRPSAKVKVRNEHGLEKLLELAITLLDTKAVVSCLWAIRNTIAENPRNQDFVGAVDGIKDMIALYDRRKSDEDVVEAILAVLVALVLKHPRNSQELVQFGLDMLLSIAESSETGEDERERNDPASGLLPPIQKRTHDHSHRKPHQDSISSTSAHTQAKSLDNRAIAREVLQLIAPYNGIPGIDSTAGSPDKRKLHKHRNVNKVDSPTKFQIASNN